LVSVNDQNGNGPLRDHKRAVEQKEYEVESGQRALNAPSSSNPATSSMTIKSL